MSAYKKLPNDGKTFERYMNDFVALYNFCGGHATNSYYPVDYHFDCDNSQMWLDVKELNVPNLYVLSMKYYYSDPHFKDQIDFLADIQRQKHVAGIVWWVKDWRNIGLNFPFAYFDGILLKHIALHSDKKLAHLKSAKPFNPFGMLIRCPGFSDYFRDTPRDEIPYLTFDYPNIENYSNPFYSIFNNR